MSELNESRRAVLRAVCDTVVPSIDASPIPTGLWARTATDMGADQGIEQVLAQLPRGAARRDDGAARRRSASRASRSRRSARASRSCATSSLARPGGGRRRRRAGRHDALPHLRRARPARRARTRTGQTFGYPGPTARAAAGRRSRSSRSCPTATSSTLEADVCIVGSGAGGGVIAGDARAGRA